MTTWDNVEPTIRLLDGSVVLESIWDNIVSLIHSGHQVFIDDQDGVCVVPAIHPDALWCLDSNRNDTQAILNELNTRHVIH